MNTLQKRIKISGQVILSCVACGRFFFTYFCLASTSRKLCSKTCRSAYNKAIGLKPPSRLGHKYSDEERVKHSLAMMGEKNWNWKGGVGKWRERNLEYKIWREKVFVRDNHTCQHCGIKNKKGLGKSIYLEADHIRAWRDFPELRYDVGNGRTLCRPCHMKTDSWGQRGRGKNNNKKQ